MAPADTDNASPAAPAVPDHAVDHANVAHAREISLASNGDIAAAVFEPEQATQLETKFTAPYVDRGLLFFRDKSDERAFPDLTSLKRTEKPGRVKSLAAANGKTHAADALPKTVPLPVPRTVPRYVSPQPAPRYVSQQPWYTTASFQ